MSSSYRGSNGSVLLFFFLVLIWLVLKFWFEFVFWLIAPSILCFTSVLSVFFFFTWFQRALWSKCRESIFSSGFSSRFGRKKFVGPGEKIFSRVFHSLYFLLIPKQRKIQFSTPFSFLHFPSFLNSTQPNTMLN